MAKVEVGSHCSERDTCRVHSRDELPVAGGVYGRHTTLPVCGLIKSLLEIPGVASVRVDPYVVVITKGHLFDWETDILPPVLEVLNAAITEASGAGDSPTSACRG